MHAATAVVTILAGGPAGQRLAWLLLGAVSPDGRPPLYPDELPFEPEPDWQVLYFAPESERATSRSAEQEASARNDTEQSGDTSAM